jgi:membrane-bound lytic murein transglycosylase D
MTAPIRRSRHAILACSLVTIAGCVHAPERVTRDAALQPVDAVLSDGPGSTHPQPPTPPSQSPLALEPAPTADEVTQAADLTPGQYADLFDRMRVGLKLDETPGQRDIDRQLNWFVANPDYLERSFGRAELYLYHIVTQLEERGMPLELALLPGAHMPTDVLIAARGGVAVAGSPRTPAASSQWQEVKRSLQA